MLRESLQTQLRYTYYAIQKNLEGIAHEDSLVGAGEGANCINWVLGHIVASRRGFLGHFDGDHPMDAAQLERYGRGSAAIGPSSEATELDALGAMLESTQQQITALLDATDDSVFERQVPQIFEPDETEPLGVQLATLAFHEAYHSGQLGVIRHAIGKQPALA